MNFSMFDPSSSERMADFLSQMEKHLEQVQDEKLKGKPKEEFRATVQAIDLDGLMLQVEAQMFYRMLDSIIKDPKIVKEIKTCLGVFEKHDISVIEALDIMQELTEAMKEGKPDGM